MVVWVDCRCFPSFVFLGVARRLELSPCNTACGTVLQLGWHRVAPSFGTTHGVAYASCKLMPLRHVNTDVFVSTLRVVRALLREHEW